MQRRMRKLKTVSTLSTDKRSKISQTEFPRFSLEQALRIPQALWDEFAGKDAPPHDLAIALKMTPTGGSWRLLCGASLAYGLTEGGYNATRISLTDLGRRIVAPLSSGDDTVARVEAILQPRVMRAFFEKYDRAKFPSDEIARNVLVSLGLPKDRATAAVDILRKNGLGTGVVRETPTGFFVSLDSPAFQASRDRPRTEPAPQEADNDPGPVATDSPAVLPRVSPGPETAPGYPVTASRTLSRGSVVDVYKLLQRLGAGFSAEVWSATVQKAPPGVDLKKGQTVALKFYHAHAMALPDQVLRVEREYRIAQALRHPHLIRIYEFLLASPRPHHNFLVMDLAKGKPMRELIAAKALNTPQVLTLMAQLFSALDELHQAGALHRDLKPGNISVEILDGRVHATLLDLGIVSVTYEKGVTAASHFVGSKHWAPIEQLLGEAMDARSDLYGAAAVAYNALTGQEPYSSSATEAAVAVQMGRSPISLPALEGVPADVRDMINACLSYKSADRPNSARDCLDVLKRYTSS